MDRCPRCLPPGVLSVLATNGDNRAASWQMALVIVSSLTLEDLVLVVDL